MSGFDRTLSDKKVVFLDLDGTVYLGDDLLPGAVDFLNYLKERGISFYFLSNNSSRSKADYVDKLSSLGIETTKEGIILSTDGVIAFLLDNQTKDIYVVGTRSMNHMFLDAGLNIDSPDPEFVILGFDTELTYEKLKKASFFMQRDIRLIATHPDMVCPTPEGPIPDVGAFLALFEKATSRKPWKIFGKPNPEMVTHVLKKHGAMPGEALMVGDRLYTDVELARRVGCDAVLVLSGETRKKDLAGLDKMPSLVVDNIGKIIQTG